MISQKGLRNNMAVGTFQDVLGFAIGDKIRETFSNILKCSLCHFMLRTLFLAFTQNPNFTNKTREIYSFMSNIYASINVCFMTVSGHFSATTWIYFTKLKFRQLFWGAERLLKMFDSKIWHTWKKKEKSKRGLFLFTKSNEMGILNQLSF